MICNNAISGADRAEGPAVANESTTVADQHQPRHDRPQQARDGVGPGDGAPWCVSEPTSVYALRGCPAAWSSSPVGRTGRDPSGGSRPHRGGARGRAVAPADAGEHIDLSIAPESALWRVKADRGQLEQVLVNLAVNARDAMSAAIA
jgi:hypothetical protein